ncbi:hypothetical protein ILUMI_02616 [Ignelater luminosus]|uniref:Uncharacterized protein n=1 Tax=Ignelater luminosus TaxID=2038154 RepID=A0A8K0GGA7_IGNLU|nr:hypothetical protein ILUMI_02616 [Ignelater luminosus]
MKTLQHTKKNVSRVKTKQTLITMSQAGGSNINDLYLDLCELMVACNIPWHKTENVVMQFDAESSDAIKQAQRCFQNNRVEHNLSYVNSHFKILVNSIKELETQGLPLTRSLLILKTVNAFLSSAPRKVAISAKNKLDCVLKETLQVALAEIKRRAPKLLVAKKYGIPRATLQFQLGTKFAKTKHGPNTNVGKRLDEVNKSNFAPILKDVLFELTAEMVSNGFKACGVFPWSVDSIDLSKCIGTPSKECNVSYSADEILNMPVVILSENEKTNQTCVDSGLDDKIENYLVWQKNARKNWKKTDRERLPYVITFTAFKNVCEGKKKAKTEKELKRAKKQFIRNEKKKSTEMKGRKAKKNQDQHTSKIDGTLENHTITKHIPEESSNKINILQNILINSKLPGNDQDILLDQNSEIENCKKFFYADGSDDGIDDVGKGDLNLRNNTLKEYCEYTINRLGIHKSKGKIKAIEDTPIPKNKTKLDFVKVLELRFYPYTLYLEIVFVLVRINKLLETLTSQVKEDLTTEVNKEKQLSRAA